MLRQLRLTQRVEHLWAEVHEVCLGDQTLYSTGLLQANAMYQNWFRSAPEARRPTTIPHQCDPGHYSLDPLRRAVLRLANTTGIGSRESTAVR